MANNEIHKMFYSDSRDKKVTARSAAKKVTHSGCNFPTRTQEELNALNGQCVTYYIDKPMPWQDFCALPVHIQKEYLLSLARRFHVDERRLPDLLGAKYKAVTTVLSNNNLFGIMRSELAAIKATEPKMDEWIAFCDSLWKNREPVVSGPIVREFDATKDAAEAIKRYRTERNLSQGAVAKLLGVSPATVSRAERGVCSAEVATRILTDIKRQSLTEKAAEKDASATTHVPKTLVPVISETKTSADEDTAMVTLRLKPDESGAANVSLGNKALTLSGPPAMVLAAIERLFGGTDKQITISVSTTNN